MSVKSRGLVVERAETRNALTPAVASALTPDLVKYILDNASAAANTNEAIIAVVDRTGKILGVRQQIGVFWAFTNQFTPYTPAYNLLNVYAVDGAVAKARTAAFFSNDSAALTSRTVRFISQSTITQREVEGNPNIADPMSTAKGPGLVAPIGRGGHFPPGISPTDSADLFQIELTNRDKNKNGQRFNIDPIYIPAGHRLEAPDSYGVQSGVMPTAQSRGIATLPGGLPIYIDKKLVGGIGVFFPGQKGHASHEQGFTPIGNRADTATDNSNRTNNKWSLVAEGMAFKGAEPFLPANVLQPINLGGIRLESVGPINLDLGLPKVKQAVASLGGPRSAASLAMDMDLDVSALPGVQKYLQGMTAPDEWLVYPHASPNGSSPLSEAQIIQMVNQAYSASSITRAQIRLPIGQSTRMTFAISDKSGNVLGLYRMKDSTYFSIDVSVAKARNTAYYNNPAPGVVSPYDLLPGFAAGIAFNNQTFRYLALPNYPTGSAGGPGYFSPLSGVPGINPLNGENLGPLWGAAVYRDSINVVTRAAFKPDSNFYQTPSNNQNGVVFFPGSTPVYLGQTFAGGLGISGDGVLQDNIVSHYGSAGFAPIAAIRADQYFFRGVRLPFYVFPRNPFTL